VIIFKILINIFFPPKLIFPLIISLIKLESSNSGNTSVPYFLISLLNSLRSNSSSAKHIGCIKNIIIKNVIINFLIFNHPLMVVF
jgi:hypothetical protein